MNWLPISSAPQDDTTVLLWEPTMHDPSGRVSLGSFREDGLMPELGAMWLQNDYDDFSCSMESTPVRATHWMPLPDPPASRMEAQRGETVKLGSTAEGGDSLTAESGDAQTPTPSSRERK